MINGCYTFKELKNKYNWQTNEGCIESQVRWARNRGVIIEPMFKQGVTYFKIFEESQSTQTKWQLCLTNPHFEVSKEGFIRNAQNKKLLTGKSRNADGYLVVVDPKTKKQYRVHRLIKETFDPIQNMENFIVDHINGVRDDNRLENLRWLTKRQNSQLRDENFAELNQQYQQLILKYGYEEVKNKFNEWLKQK